MTGPRRAPRVAAAGVSTTTVDTDGQQCTCCEPRNPLVLRPDLGTLPGGAAEFALCVLHEPEPGVYRNRGDGVYIQDPGLSLSPAGEIVDAQGNTVARVASDGFQRLTTVDDDDRPSGSGGASADPADDRASQPRTVHVDLSQDDFYHRASSTL